MNAQILYCLISLLIISNHVTGETSLKNNDKPRVVVITDIGGDPDDEQSLVRFLLYSCDLSVEGLISGFGWGHDKITRPDLIKNIVEAYGKVRPNLVKHRSDYPDEHYLRSIIKDGHNGNPSHFGPGMNSEASEHIINVIDKNDSRPVWFVIWGGPRELTQAIWKVQNTRSAKQLQKFKKKIRVYSIALQDKSAHWLKNNHKDLFWIYSQKMHRGMWKGNDKHLISIEWVEKHVRYDHGLLGMFYPLESFGKKGVKEGDSPSFLYLIPNGLNDSQNPQWGGWGGRFSQAQSTQTFLQAKDIYRDKPDMYYPIFRWRRTKQNEFEARMDWCHESFEDANHSPQIKCNNRFGTEAIRIKAKPGATLQLSAEGSTDPDKNALSYNWWIYHEAGKSSRQVTIKKSKSEVANVLIPEDLNKAEIHVILEVTDNGEPALSSYRRIVITI